MAEATQLAEEDAAGGAALSETRPFRLRDAALIAEIVGLQLAQSNDLAREDPVHLVIEGIACRGCSAAPCLDSKSNRDFGRRTIELCVGGWVLNDDAK